MSDVKGNEVKYRRSKYRQGHCAPGGCKYTPVSAGRLEWGGHFSDPSLLFNIPGSPEEHLFIEMGSLHLHTDR